MSMGIRNVRLMRFKGRGCTPHAGKGYLGQNQTTPYSMFLFNNASLQGPETGTNLTLAPTDGKGNWAESSLFWSDPSFLVHGDLAWNPCAERTAATRKP